MEEGREETKDLVSKTSAARKASLIRLTVKKFFASPTPLILMSSGMPNPKTFPIQKATVTLWNGEVLELQEADVQLALQYTATPGMASFLQTLCELQRRQHRKELQASNLCLTSGSSDAVSKCLRMLLEPCDAVLLELSTLPSTLAEVESIGCRVLRVAIDERGILPSDIEEAFNIFNNDHNTQQTNDNTQHESCNKVTGRIKCLYLCTSLASTPLRRRQQVLQLARQKNFLILEHDPFFFITHPKSKTKSYLELDTQDRVLRIDSFSNVISPGIRLGFLSGPQELVCRAMLHVEVNAMHISSLAQVLLLAFFRKMSFDGFVHYCEALSDYYDKNRHIMLKAVHESLSDFYSLDIPQNDFVLWLKPKRNLKIKFTSVVNEIEAQKVFFCNGKEPYIDERESHQVMLPFDPCDQTIVLKVQTPILCPKRQ